MKVVVMLSKQFFPAHPAAGKPTRFADKVKTGEKRHTCRCNFEYWKAKIARLHEVGGVLCLRQWEGKPYGKGTKQETIMELPAGEVDVQQLVLTRHRNPEGFAYRAEVEGHPVDVEQIAKNDGLTLPEFKAWFNPVFDEWEGKVEVRKGDEVIKPSSSRLTFAIIHFSTFRY